MNEKIYIIGHRNPDTDSICSAIVYAELKRKQGYKAVAGRLGELNRETKFVLEYFGVESPVMISNVKTQISDLDMDKVNNVFTKLSLKKAWTLMKKNNIKALPVVDENEKLLGIVTLSDLANKYMDVLDDEIIAASGTTLENIIETLNAKLLCGSHEEFKTTGKVRVAALNTENMENYIEKGDIVITANRVDSLLKSVELGVNCIIMTCGSKAEDEFLEAAKRNKCIVMSTMFDSFTTAKLINQSIPIGYVMTRSNIEKFNIDDYVDEIRDKMLKTRYRSYPVIDNSNRFMGFISRYHLISHRRKQVILVDHNEKSHTVDGIEEAEILEIIDHHRIGDIQTAKPIFVKNEPVGSTSTIIANIYFESDIKLAKKSAGLLCAAIISDTIKFKSPTSTYIDRITAEKLAEISEIDIDDFAMHMFKAGSTLKDKRPKEIFYEDFKEFKLGKYKIGIAQIYTIDFESLNEIKAELIEFMNDFHKKNGYNLVILLVTDILKQGSEFMFAGEARELVAKAFNININPDENSVYFPGIVSRKKQVIPLISVVCE